MNCILVEGDMVRVRGIGAEPSKEATFIHYVYGKTASPITGPKYAMVCWHDVDPAQMRATARQVLVRNITPLGRKHPSFEIAHKWNNKPSKA